jgi:PAS domain S-box-containing protein
VEVATRHDIGDDATFRAYLQAALDCVVVADGQGHVVEFNPAAEQTFGYSREEALGKPLSELIVPPSLRERHVRALATFAATRVPTILGRRLELTAMRADGSEFPMELVLSQVGGEPLLVCASIRDLSDTKRAENDLRALAGEQGALRSVATLVARSAPPAEVFAAVAAGVADVLGVPAVNVLRFEPNGTATKIGGWGEGPFTLGQSVSLDQPSVMASVVRTGRPDRCDDYAAAPGAFAALVTALGLRSGVGAPIILGGHTWGVVIAYSAAETPHSTAAEERLTRFTELVATAISNEQARDDLRGLAEEQAALRRVATLVARGTEAQVVFDAVCVETAQLTGATHVNLAHFMPGGVNLTEAGWSLHDTHLPAGTCLPLEGGTVRDLIRQRAATARVDDYDHVPGALADLIRRRGIRSEIGAPVVVQGQLWGALVAGTDRPEPLPASAEQRVASFAELVATAVSSTTARSELIESRARVVATADACRKKLTRDLHDGAQQQFVNAVINLQLAQRALRTETDRAGDLLGVATQEAMAGLDTLRDLAAGIHPSLLTTRGLSTALEELVDRLPLPVRLDVDVDRLLPAIEASAYYFCSEALTNVVKHAQATSAGVRVARVDDVLTVEVSDDGKGGATTQSGGTGLLGLYDRVGALEGALEVASPPLGGTTLRARIPIPSGSA